LFALFFSFSCGGGGRFCLQLLFKWSVNKWEVYPWFCPRRAAMPTTYTGGARHSRKKKYIFLF
jgi:hypothetical protein